MTASNPILAVLAALCLSSSAIAFQGSPSIEISTVPPYGATGSMTGVVSGVNFATHRVACFIHLEGQGWWTKPTYATPSVTIDANGAWIAPVTTGGADHLATIFCAVLIPDNPPLSCAGCPGPACSPSCAEMDVTVPVLPGALATAFKERYGPTLTFAGRTWAIKESIGPVGPGGNVFSSDPNDVWVDTEGLLHLTVRFHDNTWWATEVILLGEYPGYGTYSFTTETELEDLDPKVTFGGFIWDAYGDNPQPSNNPNREIDSEDSKWCNPTDTTTSQFVVQPFGTPGNLRRYTLPDLSADRTLTRSITWQPTQVSAVAASGFQVSCNVPIGSIIFPWNYSHNPGTGNYVPPEGRERFRFNVWQNCTPVQGPLSGQTVEVIVSDFSYSCSPLCTVAPYCSTAPNSVGQGAFICSRGTTSIGANDFELAVAQTPPGKFGMFYYGSGQTQVPFGNGFKCVSGGASGAFRLQPPLLTSANGAAIRLLNFAQPPAGSGPGQVTPGSTWYFQFWYRDPAGGGSGFNLSDALAAAFGL